MDEEDIAFELEPTVEDLDVEDPQDVYEMIEDEEIGLPTEYGYEDPEKFVSDVIRRIVGDQQYEILQSEELDKWERFIEEYDTAGGVFYNPENGDEWITNDEDLV